MEAKILKTELLEHKGVKFTIATVQLPDNSIHSVGIDGWPNLGATLTVSITTVGLVESYHRRV